MTTSRRVELLCSLSAGVYGILLLTIVFLQPYGDSRAADQWVTLHPGIPDASIPYIVAFGLPILGIAIGGIIDATRGALLARILLWLASAVLIVEAGLAILSIGIFLVPAVVLGLCASAFAIDAMRASRHTRAIMC